MIFALGLISTNVVITFALLLPILGAAAGPATPPCTTLSCDNTSTYPDTCCNGDVNGTGDITISDATDLLRYLFVGGSAPAAIAGAPDLAGTRNLTVTASSDQTIISSAGDTIVQFDAAVNDTLNEFDVATGTYECAVAGTYLVTLQLTMLDSPAGPGEPAMVTRLRYTPFGGSPQFVGAAPERFQPGITGTPGQYTASVTRTVDLQVGDRLQGSVSVGANTDTLLSTDSLTYMQITQIR